jgi:ATP-dependent Clp protease ATP-binding subunit ClpC
MIPLDKCNDAMRRVVTIAMSDAYRLKHPAVGTEHLLAAIMGDAHNEAALALMSLGITRAQMLATLLSLEIPCKIVTPPLPLAPIASQVFALMIQEWKAHPESHIGPEHLLLAMTQLPECAAMQMLLAMGVVPEQVRVRMKARMG